MDGDYRPPVASSSTLFYRVASPSVLRDADGPGAPPYPAHGPAVGGGSRSTVEESGLGRSEDRRDPRTTGCGPARGGHLARHSTRGLAVLPHPEGSSPSAFAGVVPTECRLERPEGPLNCWPSGIFASTSLGMVPSSLGCLFRSAELGRTAVVPSSQTTLRMHGRVPQPASPSSTSARSARWPPMSASAASSVNAGSRSASIRATSGRTL